MDKALLVKSEIELGYRIVAALMDAAMPITFFDWEYIPQLQEWHLIIATPWIDEKGALTSNRAFVDALKRNGVYMVTPTRRVFLRSPLDPIVRSMQIDAAERSEGFLHILKDVGTQPASYSIIFAPTTLTGDMASIKRVGSLSELEEVLTGILGIKETVIKPVLDEVERTNAASMNSISFTRRQIKRLELI